MVVNDDLERVVTEVAGILAGSPRIRDALPTAPPHDLSKDACMAERRNLMNPRMEHLLVRVDSKFTLVTLSAMRAREINDYYNQLGEGLGKIVPPQVTSVSRKPLSIAMEEIEVGKIEWQPLPTEEELAEIAAAEAAAAEAAAAERARRRLRPGA